MPSGFVKGMVRNALGPAVTESAKGKEKSGTEGLGRHMHGSPQGYQAAVHGCGIQLLTVHDAQVSGVQSNLGKTLQTHSFQKAHRENSEGESWNY